MNDTDLPEPHTSDPEESVDAKREAALKAGLDDFDLTDEELAETKGETTTLEILPVVAIVGRPNVGKSTLVNRIVGGRVAVVEGSPGVTRDRVAYAAEWAGRDFTLMDTGGWETKVTGLDRSVTRQAEVAIDLADVVVLVVDATVGISATDERVAQLLRRSGKSVVLCANKIDGPQLEPEAAALWNLGLGEPYPVSALHGRGSGDMLDAIVEALPRRRSMEAGPDTPRRVALVGRPNVGKSSLLNRLAGQERVIVDDTAGTTRDPVDETVEIDGRPWVLIDTAGIRRRAYRAEGADYFASLRTEAAIRRAEVAVVLLDASQPVTEQDTRILSQVEEAGRAMVLALNKWDLVDEEVRDLLERSIERELGQVAWAPRINVSAETGWHVNRLVPALDLALSSWDQRISTGRLNAFLGELVAEHPHPVRGGKQPRILFATQGATRPPRFVLFTSGKLDAGYRRFLERRLREKYGFEGSPIDIIVKVKERKKRR